MSRAAATKKVVELLSKFDGYNDSVKEVENMLNDLSDKDFDKYMKNLRDGEEYLPYYVPNMSDVDLTTEKNIKIGEELGHEFFQRLWLTDKATASTYLTPIKYMVVDLPFKRLQQHLHKKIRIPEDNRHVDERTGQVTGPSKGSNISFPELQVLNSYGLDNTIRELFMFRGGDEENYRNLERDALEGGLPDMDAVEDPDSRVKAADVLNMLLRAQHIDNNF